MSATFLAAALCAAMPWGHDFDPQRVDACVEVVTAAEQHGVQPAVAVALAWNESRFNPDARSSAGAVGVMQVIPHYHCPGRTLEGCDVVDAGLRSLGRYLRRDGFAAQAWGAWTAGSRKACERSVCTYNAGRSCTVRAARRAAGVCSLASRVLEDVRRGRELGVDRGESLRARRDFLSSHMAAVARRPNETIAPSL